MGVAGTEWNVSVIQHLVFKGSYDLTMDEKHRVLIPLDIRKKIVPERDGNAFIAIEGVDGRIWLYPETYYDALLVQGESQPMPNADVLAYHRWNLGATETIELDKQGRLLLPERTLKESGLGREVTLVGVSDHLELWNRAEWEAELEALRRRKAEISLKRPPQARPPQSPQG
jgi:MraZ protein